MDEGVEAKASSRAVGFAAQVWCEKEAANKVMDVEIATAVAKIIDPFLDTIETAWGIIANANNGDWDRANPSWREAAERWRDERWHRILDGRLPK